MAAAEVADDQKSVEKSNQDDQQHTRDLTNLVTDGKNSKTLLCERCDSKVLLPGFAAHVVKEIFLPHMKKKSEQQKPEDGETLTDFWLVQGMYTFENVGFTNTVSGDIKYMTCADCEVGPIGWSSLQDRNNFYIALDRVKHV